MIQEQEAILLVVTQGLANLRGMLYATLRTAHVVQVAANLPPLPRFAGPREMLDAMLPRAVLDCLRIVLLTRRPLTVSVMNPIMLFLMFSSRPILRC